MSWGICLKAGNYHKWRLFIVGNYPTVLFFFVQKSLIFSPFNAQMGPCRGYFPRWHFSPKTKMCLQFIYGGCRWVVLSRRIKRKTTSQMISNFILWLALFFPDYFDPAEIMLSKRVHSIILYLSSSVRLYLYWFRTINEGWNWSSSILQLVPT